MKILRRLLPIVLLLAIAGCGQGAETWEKVPPPKELARWTEFRIYDSKLAGCGVLVYSYLDLKDGTTIWRYHLNAMQAPFLVSKKNGSKVEWWLATKQSSNRVMTEYEYYPSQKTYERKYPNVCDAIRRYLS
jgi:hypothetical protein